MDENKLVLEAEKFMLENIPKSRATDDGSYLRHVLGARKYALYLAQIYDADLFIVEVVALLHDFGADVGKVHAKKSAEIANKFLSGLGVEDEVLNRILLCISRHSMGSEVDTIEEQIIQDADGIIFLEDTFKYFLEKVERSFH